MAQPEAAKGEITEMLQAWSDSTTADGPLLEAVYQELRRLAQTFLRGERASHTWQPSDLIHEAYLRLSRRRQSDWQDRRHFLAVAAQCMRRILIDHARRRLREKRGEGVSPLPLDEALLVQAERLPHLVLLDEALGALGEVDPFKAKLVELRFFAGFTIAQTAEVLSCSHATVERHWRLAQAWLYAEMEQS